MPTVFRRVVKQSGLYALGNVAVKAAGLLLAPILLNPAYLSIEAYGYFALLNVTAQLGIFVVGLGLGTGLLRYLTAGDVEHRDALPFTALLTTLFAALIGAGLLWLLAAPLARLLLDDAGQARLIGWLAVYIGFKVVGGVPMVLLRVRERAGWYALAVMVEMGLLLAGVYVLLVMRGEGLEGVMRAYALAAGGSTVVLLMALLPRIPWRFERAFVGPLIRFGAPLVLAGLAGWFLNAGDRYLLSWLADPVTTGLYDWSARLAGVINMLFVQSFQLAFNVIGLKALGAGDDRVHGRVYRHYVVWTGWAVLGLSLLTYDVMQVLVDHLDVSEHYLGAQGLVLPLALGFHAYGVYMIATNVLYATGDTGLIGFNVALAALLNAALNLLLIPWLGALGAALTTYMAYALLALLAVRQATRRHAVRFPFSVYARTVGLVGVLGSLGGLSGTLAPLHGFLLRLVLVLVYVPMLFGLRLYRWEEVKAGWSERYGSKGREPDRVG